MAVYHLWRTDQELPGIPLEHQNYDGTIVDLSSGWTFTAKLVYGGSTVVTSQTTNMTGAATSPNLTIDKWTSTVLSDIAAHLTSVGLPSVVYELQVYLRRTADSADELPMSTTPLRVEFKTAAA